VTATMTAARCLVHKFSDYFFKSNNTNKEQFLIAKNYHLCFTDERSCVSPPPGSPCRHTEFRCANGNQCIPKGNESASYSLEYP
jgi:hypothetical protein